jgi:hypothetical protein
MNEQVRDNLTVLKVAVGDDGRRLATARADGAAALCDEGR